ncbi:tRNA (adenosine(37)-N6)-dimethylallyltransferase MiaA [Candidatus Saccharibacteria bacterium]|nr:tRNA (adenosine(37)-N6)-dimethylallyltransferase MiaA [Candidatus Saccharibacteria bacterium]
MKSKNPHLPSTKCQLLTIVGPTASGKSALALQIAKEFNGEIVAADSRTIYKGMDIGTAKPSAEDRRKIRHFGLDLIEPGESFNAHKFKIYAECKIADIVRRGKLPILVGGTGLYVDGVVFDFGFLPKAGARLRQQLESMSVERLQAKITQFGYKMPENRQNKRHLIRTIETQGRSGSSSPKPNVGTMIIGLKLPDGELKQRIAKRAHANFDGLVEETKTLVSQYGEPKLKKTGGIPYLTALDYLAGELNHNQAIEQIIAAEWQYARRQKTWFKRNPFIKWFSSADEAFLAVKSAKL